METELEPRVKPLAFKVKATSRETPTQKSIHVIDTDLRTCWSSGTNTKEWILLELQEPCLLSHIRIHNKSVLEWEIMAGLQYKPETFVKIRTRCEAPRRDMVYSMNYTSCRYVRISCLRGNPIAIFFIQLIGISVCGLEPEFQPVVNYLLPKIVPHEQDSDGLHLQLLQDITSRLHGFLPQLEAELTKFADESDSSARFLAMLAEPFYPILHIVRQRETARCSAGGADSEVSRNGQLSSALTVSSNFEPRRLRSSTFPSLTVQSAVFRPDAIFMLLRKAFTDDHLGALCKVASRVLHLIAETNSVREESSLCPRESSSVLEEQGENLCKHVALSDFSILFGDDFITPEVDWDSSYMNVLDVGAVEEGILHVMYACASEPLLCSKLAANARDFWLALPLIQALLPALRPSSCLLSVDDAFTQWMQPFVQQALSKIVSSLSSTMYHPLLRGCAGYLSSFPPSHAKTSCVLIDLCSSALAPWMPQIVAKIDLAMELLAELLGVIQSGCHPVVRVRSALIYIVLAIAGYMDEVLTEYKEANLKVLFLVEMLEVFLKPVISVSQNLTTFSEMSYHLSNNYEDKCATSLHVIRAAVKKPSVLPSLESEWRRGSVPPSVLLSILDPDLPLPSDIDHCKSSFSKIGKDSSNHSPSRTASEGNSSKCIDQDGGDRVADFSGKVGIREEASLYFTPEEIRNITLVDMFGRKGEAIMQASSSAHKYENQSFPTNNCNLQANKNALSDSSISMKYFSLNADYAQLLEYDDCQSRASEFRRLALDLDSKPDTNLEGHNAAIDALILSAECYINPFFMMSVKEHSKVGKHVNIHRAYTPHVPDVSELREVFSKGTCNLKTISSLERRRDKAFVQILLEAAEMDRNYYRKVSDEGDCPYGTGPDELGNLLGNDAASSDAITLVRRKQALLCKFIIQQLQRKQQSLHETLMHSLVFLLHSSTKLACSSEDVIDIIVGSAEHLNSSMMSMFHQYKDGVLRVNAEKLYRLQRRWMLLQSLVIASSGGSSGSGDVFNVTGFRYSNLIPPSAWISKIAMFSSSTFPLVRFLGWMAISRNAEAYLNQGICFTSKLTQLTQLLTIFVDDLAGIDGGIKASKKDHMNSEELVRKPGSLKENFRHQQYQEYEDQSFSLSYPELSVFFPRMHEEFKAFRESILEAVGLQLRSFTSTALPDILSWLSELCMSPFQEKLENSHRSSRPVKGYHVRNAKAIILFILEAVITEHMEALVPETPRLLQVLGSLCRSSYCDVSFLKCVLCLLIPIISYSLRKVSREENHLTAEPCINYESLCFNEFFMDLKKEQKSLDSSTQRINTALIIFILASVFHDLSYERKREFIQSSIQWVDFPALEPTTVLQDYLFSFQQLLRSCNEFLAGNLKLIGVVPISQTADVNVDALGNKGSESRTWFPDDFCYGHSVNIEKSEGDGSICYAVCADIIQLSVEDMEGLTQDIYGLLCKLSVAIESCWNLHPQLSESLAVCYAQCLMYSICLASVMPLSSQEACGSDEASVSKSFDEFTTHWEKGIEGLAENVSLVLANNCWEVASTMIDCILRVPTICSLVTVVGDLSSVMEKIIYDAPKMVWRLRADRWLSKLFSRGMLVHESGIHLLELVSKMLNHPEPEQRYSALVRLGEPLGLNVDGGWAVLTSPSFKILASHNTAISVSDPVLSHLVSNTWDQVALVAATDASLHLRTLAKALLVHYIPFASLGQLRAFLQTADTVFQGLGNIVNPNGEGLFSQLSLALLAGVCLYCPSEDMALVPRNVWAFVQNLAESKTGRDGEMEKRICQALCKVRDEQNDAKDALNEALSSRALRESDREFGSTRESVLQVLANLTSAQSYFDLLAEKLDQEATELEEAELELDILKNEGAQLGSCEPKIDLPFPSSSKDTHRLDQIKSDIQSLEKHRLREEIMARRQNKLLLRRTRQKYLEEATLRETELLQELDRQKTLEMEKEIERQKSLELERARTNELRYNLELEKERQTQREIQRELEQVESGSKPQRREFSSTHPSRPRDRYKDRDIGRTGSDSSLRASGPSMQAEMPVNPSVATTPAVLSGSRSFSGQPPTILQSRDRSDECSSSYEENFDGSKDSGDTGSTGDPELVSGFDGLPGGYGTSQRHGSRGSKSRQILERRERDGRREGKWERKHS